MVFKMLYESMVFLVGPECSARVLCGSCECPVRFLDVLCLGHASVLSGSCVCMRVARVSCKSHVFRAWSGVQPRPEGREGMHEYSLLLANTIAI